MPISTGVGPDRGDNELGAFAPPVGLPAPVTNAAPSPPPPPPPPGARPSNRVRNRWIAAAVGGVLVVAAIAVVGAVTKDDSAAPPSDWDPRVADLIDFVQNERGLLYDHPVPIDFLTEQQYSDRVADRDKLTDEDIAAARTGRGRDAGLRPRQR